MNKNQNKTKKSDRKTHVSDEIKTWKYDKYYLYVSVFVVSGLYFYLFGNYIFFYQENLSLFIFSGDYLRQFALKPGGVLEYLGNFLTQFYYSKFFGGLILSSLFTCLVIVYDKINNKLSDARQFSPIFAAIATCFLILIQTNINYRIHNNLGFLLSGVVFLFYISSGKKIVRLLIILLFPVYVYLAGAYAWIFLGMFTIYNIIKKNFIYSFGLLLIAGIFHWASKEFLFLQPWSELLYYPLPLQGYFNYPLVLWLLLIFFAVYPALIIFTNHIKLGSEHFKSITAYALLFILLATVGLLARFYDKNVAGLFKIEKMFFAGDWNGVIRKQETDRYNNLVAQYYYNTALSENGILCNRMFFAPQDFGTQAIMIPWNSQISFNKIFRAVYFYYSVGLINEAHRWAFESMVIQGLTPENIKMLIKTDLINGHFKVAEKYINILLRTLHYRTIAKKYDVMLKNPELIRSDPELGEKMKLKPQTDFLIRIRNPEKNIEFLLGSNPSNKKAFEYKLAGLMLEKKVPEIIKEIFILKDLGYTKIPRHLEEAALLFRTRTGQLIELNGLEISTETNNRFSKYVSSGISPEKARPGADTGIQKELRNTFWFYLDFK